MTWIYRLEPQSLSPSAGTSASSGNTKLVYPPRGRNLEISPSWLPLCGGDQGSSQNRRQDFVSAHDPVEAIFESHLTSSVNEIFLTNVHAKASLGHCFVCIMLRQSLNPLHCIRFDWRHILQLSPGFMIYESLLSEFPVQLRVQSSFSF